MRFGKTARQDANCLQSGFASRLRIIGCIADGKSLLHGDSFEPVERSLEDVRIWFGFFRIVGRCFGVEQIRDSRDLLVLFEFIAFR